MPLVGTGAYTAYWIAGQTTSVTTTNANVWTTWVAGGAYVEPVLQARFIESSVSAERLLKSLLTEDQLSQYERERAFTVLTKRGRYKITHGWAGNIFFLNNNGSPVEKFCIHPEIEVPIEDSLVAQKLLLETDELTFLRSANRSVRIAAGWIPTARAA